jgi:cytochrome c-type biogenesis protein
MIIENISYSAAFLAGILSFFSPCVLPLIPAYFTFITGYSLEELTNAKSDSASGSDIKKRVFSATLCYVAGFSAVFIMLGASASFFGGFIHNYKDAIRIAGGIIIIILGCYLMGIIKIKAFDYEKRLQVTKKPLHFFSIFLVGMAFGAGWTPCIGPLLGSILIIAGNKETILDGIILLFIYSMGLAIPFLLISLFIQKILGFLKKVLKKVQILHTVAGGLLIFLGFLLVFNKI